MNYAAFLRPRYEPGDVINSGMPYAYVLLNSSRGRYCACCVRPTPAARLTACPDCQFDSYCGPECRQAALAFHRFECPLLAAWTRGGKRPEQLLYMTRMLFRALVRRAFEGAAAADTDDAGTSPSPPQFPSMEDPGWRKTFDDLWSNEETLKMRPDLCQPTLANFDEFWRGSELLQFELPPRDRVLATYGRLRTNCCELYDPELRNIGRAVYLSPSVVNHSCDPNSVFVSEGLRVVWRATRRIDTASEQIFFYYVDEFALFTAAERHELCKSEYLFECRCLLCDGSEAAARRDRRLTSVRCMHGDDCRKMADCDYCSASDVAVGADERAEAEGEAKRVLAAMAESESRGEQALTAELALRYLRGEQRLGVCNVHVIRVREGLVRACYERAADDDGVGAAAESWRLGVAEGLVLLDVYELLYFRPAWPVGKLRVSIGAMMMRSGGQAEAAEQQFVEALKILKVTHGADHEYVQSTERRLAACRKTVADAAC